MSKFAVTIWDTRFDDMGLSAEERVNLLGEMLVAGVYDVTDKHVMAISIKDESEEEYALIQELWNMLPQEAAKAH